MFITIRICRSVLACGAKNNPRQALEVLSDQGLLFAIRILYFLLPWWTARRGSEEPPASREEVNRCCLRTGEISSCAQVPHQPQANALRQSCVRLWCFLRISLLELAK